MKKIFKVAGNTTEMFQRFDSYQTFESFLHDEECFAEWLKEYRKDLVESGFSHFDWYKLDLISDEEWQILFNKYNEETETFIKFYRVNTVEEAIEAHNKLLEKRESFETK